VGAKGSSTARTLMNWVGPSSWRPARALRRSPAPTARSGRRVMRYLALAIFLAGTLISSAAFGQWSDKTLQRRFVEAMEQLDAGNLAQAEKMLRDLLGYTGAPRVKLELARTLYLQGKYAEAKKLFNEVST